MINRRWAGVFPAHLLLAGALVGIPSAYANDGTTVASSDSRNRSVVGGTTSGASCRGGRAGVRAAAARLCRCRDSG
jgi:hypothetical protein